MSGQTDLSDPAVRAAVTARLGELYAGRSVVVGPGPLAGWSGWVRRLQALGCRVLVVATSRGTGPVAEPDAVVEVTPPPAVLVSDELGGQDRLVRTLPTAARAAIDRFDPDRSAVWLAAPFVTSDEPIDGRTVTGGRPASYLALEDKSRADAVWVGAGVTHPPYRLVGAGDAGALAAATADLSGPLGAVWSGDGFNGGGEYVRWVRDPDDQLTARAFFAQHCARVRVLPFLDGVPCSIHAMVLPDGTAAFRPVEIAVLRDPSTRRLLYGGLGTFWDPPPADRDEMRAVARRVGAHLAAEHDYRGAFGVDGVLGADGFRPTELNTRMSAGLSLLARADVELFALLHVNLLAGVDTGLRAADVETVVPLLDEHRQAHVVALATGTRLGADVRVPLHLAEAAGTLVASDTASGFHATLDPCSPPGPDGRVAPALAALLAHLDATYGSSFGALEPAPDVRTR
ncbi:ATP-grasp domain-containing protein [Nocardioides sp. W7]|uniref:ATP-grasp domain-containing protein n=1 Tax=Nocardioides sp. W7 TaxID=2931390 RepID=UPI001FD44DF1|nr:ATP-grasp domain-containing protein [Nocardioides sp. W7]